MIRHRNVWHGTAVAVLCWFLGAVPAARAGVGDPQVATDDPWYPGELACSTFERLFATQAEVFERVTGKRPTTDEQKALAAWLWRNTHYAHGEEGAEDLWGKGFKGGGDLRTREYWTGLFSHGFGLCGTTHAQWTAELEALFGHGRSRVVGVAGHNSFEVFLAGGPYGAGQWALLDHDLSTVIFDEAGKRLLPIAEVRRDWKRWTDRGYKPGKQHGWPVCGLHPADGASYSDYNAAEYLAGYAGPPPMTHLRRGETLRRYLRPGLEDGKTFVFWGRNYNAGGVPGLERSQSWVNQPHRLLGSRDGAGYHVGQARNGNAVYTYRPDFATGDYREGVVEEDDRRVVLEFSSPYVIAATPADDRPWGVYEPGCRNGLVLHGRADCPIAVSTDRGKTWQDAGAFRNSLDLTDRVKGHRQYLLRLGAGAAALRAAGLEITTVCQANPAVMPRLKAGGSVVRYAASGKALVSAGPTMPAASARVVDGRFGSPKVTLELSPPRGEPVVGLHAAAHVLSGNPPDSRVKYRIEFSADRGKTWWPLVRDWSVTRRGDQPPDCWSQSFCWGSLGLSDPVAGPVQVRFGNDGGKSYARCELHLVYRVKRDDPTRVTFAWSDDQGDHQASHTFAILPSGKETTWDVPTGRTVQTRWVEFRPAPGP